MRARRIVLVLAVAALLLIGAIVVTPHSYAQRAGPPNGSDLLFPYWHSEIVDSEGDVGSSVALAVAANGEIHLAYYDATNSALKHAHGKPGSWQTETVDDAGIAGLCPALALDGSGRPHISYATAADISIGGSSSVNAQRYARWTGAMWEFSSFDSVETEPEPGRYVCLRSAIALDDGDAPHFAYSRTFWGPPKSIGSVRYAWREGDIWQVVPRIDGFGPYAGAGLDLALAEGGRPQIAYINDAWTYAGAPEVKVSTLSGSTWISTTVDSGRFAGGHLSMQQDSFGRLLIGYHDELEEELRFARLEGSALYTETVDSTGNAGQFVAVALGNGGLPALAYHDSTHGLLKYAFWDGWQWRFETVAHALAPGSTSLGFVNDQTAVIAYYDSGNGDLLVAQRSLGPPTDAAYLPVVVAAP